MLQIWSSEISISVEKTGLWYGVKDSVDSGQKKVDGNFNQYLVHIFVVVHIYIGAHIQTGAWGQRMIQKDISNI